MADIIFGASPRPGPPSAPGRHADYPAPRFSCRVLGLHRWGVDWGPGYQRCEKCGAWRHPDPDPDNIFTREVRYHARTLLPRVHSHGFSLPPWDPVRVPGHPDEPHPLRHATKTRR